MSVEANNHWIGGTFPGEAPGECFNSQYTQALSPNIPGLVRHGEWLPEELRLACHDLGSVAIFGHCLANRGQIEDALKAAVEDNDERMLTHLPGSYTTILTRRDKLTMYADLVNQFPIYYRQEGSRVHFSSLAAPVRESNWRPDRLSLAAFIGTPWVSQLHVDRSFTEGIHRLEAGQKLTITREGRVLIEAYEDFTPTTKLSMEEAAYNLRTALLQGLRLRANLGRSIVSDFSGGLDSTSLSYLLAKEYGDKLPVVTLRTPEVPSADENYVRKYLQLPESQSLFDWFTFATPAARNVYDGLLTLPQTDEPDVSVAERGRSLRLYHFLREAGHELHITGNGADGLVDLSATQYLGDILKTGNAAQFIQASLQAARVLKVSPFAIMASSLTGSDATRELSKVAQQLRTAAGVQALSESGTAPQWLRNDVREILSDYTYERARESTITYGLSGGNRLAYGDIRSLGLALHGTMQMAERSRVREHAPFMDNGVLRACFSIPAHERVNPQVFKQFLRVALQDIVPVEVLSRTSKGGSGSFSYQSVRNAAPVLERLLQDSRLADFGVIEPAVIRATLRKAYAGGHVPWVSLDGWVASELWLRHHFPDAGTGYVDAPLTQPELPVQPLQEAAKAYGIPSHVVLIARESGGIALNVEQGTYHRLNKDALNVVYALRGTSNIEHSLSYLADKYPGVSREVLYKGLVSCVRHLVKQGVVKEGVKDFSIMTSDKQAMLPQETAMALPTAEIGRSGFADRMAAMGGFLLAIGMKRLPFERQVRILNAVGERWTLAPASEDEALEALRAVHRASQLYLGRAACLEVAMATTLALALKRKRSQVVLGIKSDPDSFHAWPEVAGIPIRTVLDEQIVGIYQPLFKMG